MVYVDVLNKKMKMKILDAQPKCHQKKHLIVIANIPQSLALH